MAGIEPAPRVVRVMVPDVIPQCRDTSSLSREEIRRRSPLSGPSSLGALGGLFLVAAGGVAGGDGLGGGALVLGDLDGRPAQGCRTAGGARVPCRGPRRWERDRDPRRDHRFGRPLPTTGGGRARSIRGRWRLLSGHRARSSAVPRVYRRGRGRRQLGRPGRHLPLPAGKPGDAHCSPARARRDHVAVSDRADRGRPPHRGADPHRGPRDWPATPTSRRSRSSTHRPGSAGRSDAGACSASSGRSRPPPGCGTAWRSTATVSC